MISLPTEPVSPRAFFEDVVPAMFADVDLTAEDRASELRVGVRLHGAGAADPEEGGAWTLHFVDGELGIAEGLADGCDLTLVQSVADWRSVLWEGRPPLVADWIGIAQPHADSATPPAGLPWPPRPRDLAALRELRGLIEVVVAGDEVQTDWRLGVLIGPGPIPEAPQATIRIGAAEAEAIRGGTLHPLEALMTGRMRLEGDLGLILQLQAIVMTALLPGSQSRSNDRGRVP